MSFSPALTTFEAAEKVLEDELLEVCPEIPARGGTSRK